MATYSPADLTGSPSGLPIPVAATATPGTLIHTAVDGLSARDNLYLWAANVTNAPATLTVEWGSAANPGGHLVHQFSLPANCPPIVIASGQRVNNGLVIAAYSSVANAINITGEVDRIS
jgi:hypothetical protein